MRRKRLLVVISFIVLFFIIALLFLKNQSKYSIEQLEILDVDKEVKIEELKGGMIDSQKFMHLSLDDFIDTLSDITKNDYNSIFENETFSYLKQLHDEYGVVFSLYTFYESENFNLSLVTDKYSSEFIENSDWLKFGFHSYNSSTNYEDVSVEKAANDYSSVVDELIRITGSAESIDSFVRLHFFAGSLNNVNAMAESSNGIKGLLGADDERRSYYLNDKANSYLYKYDYYKDKNLDFLKTDLRLENIEDIDSTLDEIKQDPKYQNTNDIMIVFTHEQHLNKPEIQEKLLKIIKFAKENGYVFDFPMNRITTQ